MHFYTSHVGEEKIGDQRDAQSLAAAKIDQSSVRRVHFPTGPQKMELLALISS
jgi:hypothetical protein